MRHSLLALLLALCLASPAGAYRAGEVVSFHVTVPALNGVATDPQSLKAYVFNGTACIDSSKTLAAGIAALPLAGGKSSRVYAWTWTVPTNMASVSARLRVACRAVTSEIPQDWVFPQPSIVPVNAATLDTLTADVVADWYKLAASSTLAVIAPGSYGATTVTSGGQPVQGAIVKLTSNATGTNVVSWGVSDALGSYRLHAVVSASTSDVFYLWAFRGTSVVKSAETVTVP